MLFDFAICSYHTTDHSLYSAVPLLIHTGAAVFLPSVRTPIQHELGAARTPLWHQYQPHMLGKTKPSPYVGNLAMAFCTWKSCCQAIQKELWMDETDGSSVEGLELTPIHLVQSLWNVYVRMYSFAPGGAIRNCLWSRYFTTPGRGIGYSFQLAITAPLYSIIGYCITTAQSYPEIRISILLYFRIWLLRSPACLTSFARYVKW